MFSKLPSLYKNSPNSKLPIESTLIEPSFFSKLPCLYINLSKSKLPEGSTLIELSFFSKLPCLYINLSKSKLPIESTLIEPSFFSKFPCLYINLSKSKLPEGSTLKLFLTPINVPSFFTLKFPHLVSLLYRLKLKFSPNFRRSISSFIGKRDSSSDLIVITPSFVTVKGYSAKILNMLLLFIFASQKRSIFFLSYLYVKYKTIIIKIIIIRILFIIIIVNTFN